MSAKKAGCKLGKCHSRVYVMGKQAPYLSYQIEGGTRTPRGTAIAVPTSNLKLNKYGNIIGGQNRVKRLLEKKYVFQGHPSKVLQVNGNAPSREGTAVVLMAILDHQN